MEPIDNVLRINWSDSHYLGDGVYTTRVDGDIALRTDHGDQHHVIVLEPEMLEDLNRFADRTRGEYGQSRPRSTFVQVFPEQEPDQR